ncbi:MAG: PEP-CTERM sorting domain-containing protein [Verrucomicrobiota bacterium]
MLKSLLSTSAALLASGLLASGASIFAPGDTIFGGQINGDNFEVGVSGTAAGVNNWPGGEPPEAAIDGAGQKYLNFGKTNTGIVITPASGSSIAQSLHLWTANDAEPRDPSGYQVWGSNAALGAGPFAVSDFTPISVGSLSLPSSRNGGGGAALDPANQVTIGFANSTAYSSYMIIFPDVKDNGAANSMQIAEIQLDTAIPEPGVASFLLLGVGALAFRRRR